MFMRHKAGQNLTQWLPLDLGQMGFICLQPSHLGEERSVSGGRMCITAGWGDGERQREAELLSKVKKNLIHHERVCLGHISAPLSEEGKEKYLIFWMLQSFGSSLSKKIYSIQSSIHCMKGKWRAVAQVKVSPFPYQENAFLNQACILFIYIYI